jgi:hypothetical protein
MNSVMNTEKQIRALFELAGIGVLRVWQLPNGYMGTLEPLTDNEIVRDTSEGSPHYVRTFTEKDIPNQTTNVVRSWMNDYRWRYNRPAWLVKTEYGLVQFTPRKRVYDIDWSETPVRGEVTSADVTKDATRVHAWSDEAALTYLKAWKALAETTVVKS